MEHTNPFIFIAEFSPDLGVKVEWLTELRPQTRAGCPDASETWKYFPLCSHPITETSFEDAQNWRGLFIKTEDEDAAHKNFDDPNVRQVEVDTQLWPAASALYEQQTEYLFRCFLHKEAISIAKTTEIGNAGGGGGGTTGGISSSATNQQQHHHHQHYSKVFMSTEDMINIGQNHPFFDSIRDVVSRIFEEVPQLNENSNNNTNNTTNNALPTAGTPSGAGNFSDTPKTNENNNNNNLAGGGGGGASSPAQLHAAGQSISNIQIITFTAPQFHHATILACVFQIRDPDVRAETRSLTVALCHPDFSVVARNSGRLTDGLVNFASGLIRESQFLTKTVGGQLYQPDPLFVRFAQYWGFEKNSENFKHQPPTFQNSSDRLSNHNTNTNNSNSNSNQQQSNNNNKDTASSSAAASASSQLLKRKFRIYSQSMKRWHASFVRILSSVIGPPIDPTTALLFPTVVPMMMMSNNNNNTTSLLSSMSVSASASPSLASFHHQQLFLEQQHQEQNLLMYQILRERDMAFRTTLLTLRRFGLGYSDVAVEMNQMNILTEVLSALFKGELVLLLPVTPEDSILVSDLAAALASLLPPAERKVLSDVPVERIKREEPFFNIIAARWSPLIEDSFLSCDVGENNNNNSTTATTTDNEKNTADDKQKPANSNNNVSEAYTPREGAVAVKISYNGGVTTCFSSNELYFDCRKNDIQPPDSVPAVAHAVVKALVNTPPDEPVRTVLCPILEVAQKIASGYTALLNSIFAPPPVLAAGQQLNSNNSGNNNVYEFGTPNNYNNDSGNNSNQNSQHLLTMQNQQQQASATPRELNNNTTSSQSQIRSGNLNNISSSGKTPRGGGGNGGFPLYSKRDSDGLSDGGFSTGFANDSFDDRQKSLLLFSSKSPNPTPNQSSAGFRIPPRKKMNALSHHQDNFYDDEDDDDEEDQSPKVKGSIAGNFMSRLKSMFSKLDDSQPLYDNHNSSSKNRDNGDTNSVTSMATTKKAIQQYNPVTTAPVNRNNTTNIGNIQQQQSTATSASNFYRQHQNHQTSNNSSFAYTTTAQQQQQQRTQQHQDPNFESGSYGGGGGSLFNNMGSNGGQNNSFLIRNNNNNGSVMNFSAAATTMIESDYLLRYLHTHIDLQEDLTRDQKIFLSIIKKTISIEDRTNYALDPENFPPPRPKLTPAEALGLIFRLASHVAVSYFPQLFSEPSEADFVSLMHLARKNSSGSKRSGSGNGMSSGNNGQSDD